MIAVALALSVVLASAGGGDASSLSVAANGCTRWTSETTPPRTIRVRLSFTRIVRVDFMRYTAIVVSSEFNSVHPTLRLAGALAVKQYAWYRAMHPRPSKAGCFDVNDDTRDQIYRHHKTPPLYVWQAVEQTWHWRMVRDGRLFQSGYRTGRKGPCGFDIDRYHLFARSAARCARLGWTAQRLLSVYYSARVVK